MFDMPLLLVAAAGVALLLFMVIRLRVPAFLALLLTSFIVGLGTGMPLADIIQSVQSGMGGTLGFVAIVVGLGAILGQMLEASGGIARIADTLIRKFGSDKVQWSLGLTGFVVAIPVFFDVAFIILAPLVYGLASRSGRSLLYYAVPLLAGLAVTHAFIPPTPGPIAVADLIGADLGWVILFGALVGLPAMVLAGPVFGRFIAHRIQVPVPQAHSEPAAASASPLSFGAVMAVVLLPLVLIMLSTSAPFFLSEGTPLRQFFHFVGHPFVALSLATALAMVLVRIHCGFNSKLLLQIANKGFEPAGIIILVTGAGGAFKQLLVDSGVGNALGEVMLASQLPLVFLAFSIAAITRVAQGSATVAMITAAGLIAPVVELRALEGPLLGLLVIAISSGATILSHVNDSGFWLVSRYLGIDEKTTLKSWTLLSTIIGVVGLVGCLLLSLVV